MTYILLLWLGWILLNLGLMIFCAARLGVPCFNGFRIYIPVRFMKELTPVEYMAIYCHECGHRHHLHVWKNFALVCFFFRAGNARRWQQELEADDYAAEWGFAGALSSALRKLSDAKADWLRAERLELIYQQQQKQERSV